MNHPRTPIVVRFFAVLSVSYVDTFDSNSGLSLEELGMRALHRLPRDRAIDGIHAFNAMRYAGFCLFHRLPSQHSFQRQPCEVSPTLCTTRASGERSRCQVLF